jgi:hypothetical protein
LLNGFAAPEFCFNPGSRFFFGVVLVCSWEALPPIHAPILCPPPAKSLSTTLDPWLAGIDVRHPKWMSNEQLSWLPPRGFPFYPSFSQFLASFWLNLPDFPGGMFFLEGPLDGFHHFPWPSMANGD